MFDIDAALKDRGYVISLGQLSTADRRALDKRVKAGELRKRRGFWTDPLGELGYGLGPLKTIWYRETVDSRNA